MRNLNLKKIFIEKGVSRLSITQEILSKLPKTTIEYVDDYRTIRIEGKTIDDVYKESKECLVIARKKGGLIKEFRCREGIVGRSEYYIAHGNNCCFDCEYCFLQSYLDNAVPTVFINHGEILSAIKDVIIAVKEEKAIFHAGELCDALAFDDITGLSQKLITLIKEYPNIRLELRTKSTIIENLLAISGASNIVISWTFSPQIIIDTYERKTPSLEERISAAQKVQEAGYNVGICLDPIIRCEDWHNNYKEMLDMLFDSLDVTKIKFVSLGGFRFLPSLANVIRERNPQSNLLLDEFVQCVDGKRRYFRPLRVEIYKELCKIIRNIGNGTKVSLCMETNEVWDEVGGI